MIFIVINVIFINKFFFKYTPRSTVLFVSGGLLWGPLPSQRRRAGGQECAVRLWRVWENILQPGQTKAARVHTHGGDTLRVQDTRYWQIIASSQQWDYCNSNISVQVATKSSHPSSNLRDTCWSTLKPKPFCAMFATEHFVVRTIWRTTKRQEILQHNFHATRRRPC